MRSLPIVLSCLTISLASFSVSAQDSPPPRRPEGGRQGMAPPLSPEKAKAAWELEAKGVAASLGFNPEQTKATVDAYAAARASHGEAADKMRKEMMDKARDEGAQGAFAEIQKKTEELTKTEREKLEKALAAKLSADQVKKAMIPLGTFNRQWDTMTDAISGFGLDTAKLAAAQKALEEYVVSMDKVRGSDDREAMRTAMQDARKKLSDTMKATLSEEQFGKFQASMGGGRGMGGPGGPGGPGGRPADAPKDAPKKDGK